MAKRRIFISDHGVFSLFNMSVTLPAIIELTDEQIQYITATGLYKISELSSTQNVHSTTTLLNMIDSDKLNKGRSVSVNELSFKAPIMASKYADKAKNSLIVKKNSVYAKAALNDNKNATNKVVNNGANNNTASKRKETKPEEVVEKNNNGTNSAIVTVDNNKKDDNKKNKEAKN